MSEYRVIMAHNRYRSTLPSGENSVVDREAAIWRSAGNDLVSFEECSDGLLSSSFLKKVTVALKLAGSNERRKALVERLKPLSNGNTILHLHNPWPLFTYDIAIASKSLGIPVVQTLHNYRLIATNKLYIENSVAKIARKKNDRVHITRMAAMHNGKYVDMAYGKAITDIWKRGIPQTFVDKYICLSEFQRKLLINAGIPTSKTVVKGNTLSDPGFLGGGNGGYALFVGRLDESKGIGWLMKHWSKVNIPLLVVGDGPMAKCCHSVPGVTFLGRQTAERVQALMSESRFLIMSSQWYEGHPLVMVEAQALGTPVLVPDLGAMPEYVFNGTGAVYRNGDAEDMAFKAQSLWESSLSIRVRCREEYRKASVPEVHLKKIIQIYKSVSVVAE